MDDEPFDGDPIDDEPFDENPVDDELIDEGHADDSLPLEEQPPMDDMPLQDQTFDDCGTDNTSGGSMEEIYPRDNIDQNGGNGFADDGLYSGEGYGDDGNFTDDPASRPGDQFAPEPDQEEYHDNPSSNECLEEPLDDFNDQPEDFPADDDFPQSPMDDHNEQAQDFPPDDQIPQSPVDDYNDQPEDFPADDEFPRSPVDFDNQSQDFPPDDQIPQSPVDDDCESQGVPPDDGAPRSPMDDYIDRPDDFQVNDEFPDDYDSRSQDFPSDESPQSPMDDYNDQPQDFPADDDFPQSPMDDYDNQPQDSQDDDQFEGRPMSDFAPEPQDYQLDKQSQEQPSEEILESYDTPYMQSSEEQFDDGAFNDQYDEERPMSPEAQLPMETYPDDPIPYQANEPMEIVSNVDEDNGAFPAVGPKYGKKGAHKKEKYQWLLPLMATATLGWGMEALEEQYHVANIKASGFNFAAIAAKLFGSKKSKNDPQGDRDVPGVGSPGPHDTPTINGETHPDDALQNPSVTDPEEDWEDIDENEPVGKKQGKKGLFGLFRGKKRQGDLEAQDEQIRDGRDLGLPDNELDQNIPLGEDGYSDEQYTGDPANPNADPNAERPKRGFFARLFGTKKSKSLDSESMDAGNLNHDMEQGTNEQMGDSQGEMRSPVMDEVERMSQDDPDQSRNRNNYEDNNQQPKKRGFFARLFGSKRPKTHNQAMTGDNEEYPMDTLPGQEPSNMDTISQDGNDNNQRFESTNRPKKKGFWAALFGSKRRNKQSNQGDTPARNMNEDDDEYSMEPGSYEGTDGQANVIPRDDDNLDSREPSRKGKKKGFWAAIFGSKKSKTSSDPESLEPSQSSQRKPGLFARARTVSQQNMAERRGRRPGFFSRLFGHKPRKSDDIEMGNLNQSEEARVGRVRTGSPQLHQGEYDTRNSAVADVVGEDGFEDVPDKKRKKKEKKDKRKNKGMGLFRQASLASSTKADNKRKGNAKNKRQTIVYDENGNVVPQPRRTRKSPAKVRYAPVAPSDGMHQHVKPPNMKPKGKNRPAAAAANPGNWFWMDVYWK
ncbi:hypothetical protein VTI28DRAFT_8978 [Corynascus sepedonium]